MTIKYDRKSGAYTDGKHFVRASFIRDFAKKKLGMSQQRGRISRAVLAGVSVMVFSICVKCIHNRCIH
jgi:hypothetical protein